MEIINMNEDEEEVVGVAVEGEDAGGMSAGQQMQQHQGPANKNHNNKLEEDLKTKMNLKSQPAAPRIQQPSENGSSSSNGSANNSDTSDDDEDTQRKHLSEYDMPELSGTTLFWFEPSSDSSSNDNGNSSTISKSDTDLDTKTIMLEDTYDVVVSVHPVSTVTIRRTRVWAKQKPNSFPSQTEPKHHPLQPSSSSTCNSTATATSTVNLKGSQDDLEKLYGRPHLTFLEVEGNRLGQALTVREGIAHVRTPYVAVLQHDWRFQRHVPI
jgi:hypothetical protein